jgi:hypothetical protein
VYKKRNRKRIECAYYDCHETRGLRKCWYCGKYYCGKHIRARPTSAPPWIEPDKWRVELTRQYKDAHACPEFILKPPEPIPPMKHHPYPIRPPVSIVINPAETAPSSRQPISIRGGGDEDIMQHPKWLWYRYKRGLYNFLKDTISIMVILIVLNTLLVGGFDLILIIIRSVALVIVFYIAEYLYKKTRYVIPWKWVAIAAIVTIGAGIYSTKDYSMLRTADSIVGIDNFTDKSILPIVDYLQNLNKTAMLNTISNVSSSILPQPIDSKWVDSFMSKVNDERVKNGLQPLKKAPELDAIAYSRFNTMMIHPDISHYGAGAYPVGEVVFYPAGFRPEDYATNVQNTAPLHWQLLVSPMVSYYGYYVGSGPIVQATGPCSATEIPGPNINVTQYLQEQGCQTGMTTSTWLVIDMS